MTTPGNYDTDMADMFAIHHALLTSLDAAHANITRAGQDPARVAAVASFYENVIEMLRAHHTTEDELLYPILEERCAESRAALVRIDDQHKLLPVPMQAGQAAAAAFRDQPTAPRAQAFIDAMTALRGTLAQHLADEEATVVPLAQKWISPQEVGRMAQQGPKAFHGDKPFLLLGLLREQLDQPHRDGMLMHMDPGFRTMWLERLEPAFSAFVGQVRG